MENLTPIDPFTHVNPPNINQQQPIYPSDISGSNLSIGFGSQVLRVDGSGNNKNTQGLFMGASTFANAPFSVDMLGALISSKITIKDSNNNTVIDSTGIKSSTQFLNASVINNTQRDITSNTFVDVSNTSLTTSSFPRAVNVLVLMNVQGRLYLPSSDVIQTGEVVLNVDGTNQTLTIFDQNIRDTRMSTTNVFSFDSRNFSLSAAGIFSLSSGTHTFKLQALVDGQTLRILNTSIIYILLGT